MHCGWILEARDDSNSAGFSQQHSFMIFFTAPPSPRPQAASVGLPPESSSENLLSECFAYDTILVALAGEHPLARKRTVRLADLASEFFICMAPTTEPADDKWVNRTCRAAGFIAKVLQEANDAPSVVRFVKDGLGVALMPKQITGLPHDDVVFRPLSPPLLRESSIVWRADNSSPALKDYVRIVKEVSRTGASN